MGFLGVHHVEASPHLGRALAVLGGGGRLNRRAVLLVHWTGLKEATSLVGKSLALGLSSSFKKILFKQDLQMS